MIFDKESDFEEEVIKALGEYGWEKEVLRYPTEEDLLQNWADILFNNNRQSTRLNDCPLTKTEMQQIMEQIYNLRTPLKLNGFINGRSVSIKRDNPDDKRNFGKEVSLKIYDRQEIAYGESRYQIAQQPKFKTKSPILNDRRGDLMLLINGMPVIHIELKRSNTPVSEAYNQIQKYMHEGVFRGLFSLIQVFVAMEPEETVYFANPGDAKKFNPAFYFHWENFDNVWINQWDKVVARLLNIPMAHKLIGFYTIADTDDGILKVMRSYQYYAAEGIAAKVAKKNEDWNEGGQLGGHVWHTTGSGKTMTSFKSAQLVASSHDADKVIFLVDRKELGIQSLKEYRSFADDDESVQATENTDILISKLKSDDTDNTLIVTSIQKLSNISEGAEGVKDADLKIILAKRIVIIIDECHRSTFGEMLSTIKNTFKRALIFGFTGTPIQEVNIKKDSTTATIFGDEIHRYTLANGIRDGNVLGFDPYKVLIYDDYELRHQVALHKAKAKNDGEATSDEKKKKIFYKYMDSSQVKMYGMKDDFGKWIPGIEDYVPNEQYQTPNYKKGVVKDIKDKWTVFSRDREFHAIFATNSIPEAVEYYRLMREVMPELNITAMFDPTIDNEGGGSLEKEDGIVDILKDYKKIAHQEFTIPTYDKFRKDVSLRLSHKKPFQNINKDEQIDILIVVNQMLTGFDSKWVNTLYLDKVMEYETLIQAFSRTNRVYKKEEKPFGIIKYYRRPHTMEKNIEAAVKAYSGDVPTGLFVPKLPHNLREMNRLYEEIQEVFDHSTYHGEPIVDFQYLPDDVTAIRKFAKLFKEFNTHLEAALIQGFVWSEDNYLDEKDKTIHVEIDEVTFHTLVARYKELQSGGGISDGGVPFDIDIHITEMDTGKIDADYMNSKFKLFLKLLQEGVDQDAVNEALKDLHRSYSTLSLEEQRYADVFINDVQSGNITLDPDKNFRDYISEMMKKAENDRIKKVVKRLGCYEQLLRELLSRKVTKENIDAHGTFQELKDSVNKRKATEFFEAVEKDHFRKERLSMYVDQYLRRFILSGGEDPYPDVKVVKKTKAENEESAKTQDEKEIGIVLTDADLVGKKVVSSVKEKTLGKWYSSSKAVASLMSTGCFAYIENKLCINDKKYIHRNEDGSLSLTGYAREHTDECFLQFIVDAEGKLHYVSLPAAIASKAFKYADEITPEMASKIGLVNEISKEMLAAIDGCTFGEALVKLMSKNICNYSIRLLKDTTGLDNRTQDSMRRGSSLNKLNVVSACLGIHIPFPVSNRMLELADISLRFDIPGQQGADNKAYDMILHLLWATDYDDIYDDLVSQGQEHLIHKPPRNDVIVN